MANKTRCWWGAFGALLSCSCGSPEGEELYVMHERYEHGTEYGSLSGCTLAVFDGEMEGESHLNGGLPGLEGDFTIDDFTEGDGLRVTIGSRGEVLETRDYDTAFVRKGEIDRFQVTTLAGRVFDLAYWGGPSCDTSRKVLDVAAIDAAAIDAPAANDTATPTR